MKRATARISGTMRYIGERLDGLGRGVKTRAV
jgi:hypothetical protein